jgi:hypothetical protein
MRAGSDIREGSSAVEDRRLSIKVGAHWALVAMISALGAALRFHDLGRRSLWFDEGVSVGIARLDWYNFARILWRREANMALYYLVLRLWLQLGGEEAFIRSLSVVFAIATIPVVFLIGRKLWDSRTGLIAVSLLAVSAFHIRYSQEARSYALATLLCALSSLYFLKSFETPSRRNRILHIVTSVLAVYAHFFCGLLIVAQWSAARMYGTSRRFGRNWRWIVVAVTPLALFVATTGAGPLRWIQRPGFGDLWNFGLLMAGGGPLMVAAYGFACGGAIAPGDRRNTGRETWARAWPYIFVSLWLLLPLGIIIAVSFIRPLFVARYFLFCLPALVLLAASGLARLSGVWRGAALAVFLLLGLRGARDYYDYHHDFDLGRDDWRSASRYLLDNARPGDAVVFHVAMGRLPYEYYRSLLAPARGPEVVYPHSAGHITYLDLVEKPHAGQLAASLPQFERVWIVLRYAETASGTPDDDTRLLMSLAGASHPFHTQRNFPHLEVLVYGRQHGELP